MRKAVKHTQSESGAVLILVLFSILFLAVAGTLMLSVTTYSQQALVANAEVQDEFYRAEGALELVLEEMKTYAGGWVDLLDGNGNPVSGQHSLPIQIQQTGPYFYVLDHVGDQVGDELTVDFSIGGELIEVTVRIDDVPAGNAYDVTLTARSANDSSVRRVLELEVIREEPPVLEMGSGALSSPLFHAGPFNYNGSEQHDQLNIKNTAEQMDWATFEGIMYFLGVPDANGYGKDQLTDSATFTTGTHYFEFLTYSGNNDTLYVGPDAVVFAKEVDISGAGNSGSITIDGIFVAREFRYTGNYPVTVNGALIVEGNLNYTGGGVFTINSGVLANAAATGGANRFQGEGRGIDCALIGLQGIEYCGEASEPEVEEFDPEENPWRSESVTINYRTERP